MHYNANGGTFADGSSMLNEEKALDKATTLASGGLWDDPTSKPLTYNYEITNQVSTRPGYQFAGWDGDDTLLRMNLYRSTSAITYPTAPTRTGYTFAGWKATETGIEYSPADALQLTSVQPVLHMVAQWQPLPVVPPTPTTPGTTTPNTPATPGVTTPSTPAQPTTTVARTPQTSDHSSVMLWGMVWLSAVVLSAGMLYIRRKNS